MSKCPFCGSEKRQVKTPFVELQKNGEYGPIMTFCCNAQKQNSKYIANRFNPEDAPDLDEVSKA